jgi:hypothetical protein
MKSNKWHPTAKFSFKTTWSHIGISIQNFNISNIDLSKNGSIWVSVAGSTFDGIIGSLSEVRLHEAS